MVNQSRSWLSLCIRESQPTGYPPSFHRPDSGLRPSGPSAWSPPHAYLAGPRRVVDNVPAAGARVEVDAAESQPAAAKRRRTVPHQNARGPSRNPTARAAQSSAASSSDTVRAGLVIGGHEAKLRPDITLGCAAGMRLSASAPCHRPPHEQEHSPQLSAGRHCGEHAPVTRSSAAVQSGVSGGSGPSRSTSATPGGVRTTRRG